MLVCGIGPEISTRCDGHTGALQQIARESKTVVAQRTAISIDIKRALRHHRYAEAKLAQGRQQIITPRLEFRTPRLKDGDGLRLESRHRCMLRRCGRREINILRKFFKGPQIALGHHHPAQPPAGHVEVFRKAVNDKNLVAEFERCGVITLIDEAVINLVDDHDAAARRRDGSDLLERCVRHQSTGGIRRRGHHHRTSTRRPALRHQFRRELITAVRTDGDFISDPAHHAHEVAIAGITGVRHQHFVTVVDQYRDRQQQGP